MRRTHTWDLAKQTLRFEDRPLIMGIVNVTPDSFSDGGRYTAVEAAVRHGLDLITQGADLLDLGGESTRPGATPVALDEELRRVLPVVEQLAKQTAVPLSVDTYKAEVARQSLEVGAQIINDITALTGDPAMAEVVRQAQAGLILMHMQGTPATMQMDPRYDDVVTDIGRFFETRLQSLAKLGIAKERVVLDPGIGFGKTAEHNLLLLARLEEFQQFGRPVCLGVSRKGFLGKVLDRPVEQRLAGSLAAVCHALSRRAAQLVRVHDVAATRDVVHLFTVLQNKME
ncbi:MAG: dihydropteroate synthase [Gemmataceae bacterium]|nr:dihydropteroate synthase [Gemmataceae bacterium]